MSVTYTFTPETSYLKNRIGAANGIAELDASGKVPASQLPSYVDDVVEAADYSDFPITGETGKIYVDLSTNKTYRWGGSSYVEISASLALGETESTAYRGDRGKAAYDHATAKGNAYASGLYKITTNTEGHVTNATAVEKGDITSLGVVDADQGTANAGKAMGVNENGIVVPVPFPDDDFTGATESEAGIHGYVPAPAAGDQDKALLGSGVWGTIPILIEAPLTNVSNASGAYTHTTADSRITADMKCVLLELGNPSAFKAKVVITPGNGEVTLSCADVEGESTVVASFMKVDVRNFTVTFGKEEEDGGDVLETKTLPFRSIPEYTGETPTTTRFSDDYYMFDGWNPAIAPVSGDNVYKAKFFNLLVARYLGSGLTTYESDTDTAIGSGAFYGMTGLTSIKSTATTVGANAFGGCTSLTTIDLTSPTGAVSLDATGMPESVTSIFIRSNTVGTLTGTLPTQFTEGSGIIYVHDDLLSDYESAWSTYESHIYPMNAYPVSATTTDTIKDSNEAFFRYLNDGTAQTRYDIGDTKTLNLGSEGNVQFIIAAKNADELADGSGNAGLTFVCNTTLKTTHRMNPKIDGTTEGTGAVGGWAKSEMRTYLNETIWPLLPTELRNCIKTVKKYSFAVSSTLTNVFNDMTEDKIWILSAREVIGGNGYDTAGPMYNTLFVNDNARIRRNYSGTAVSWWLRSVIGSHALTYYCCIPYNGDPYSIRSSEQNHSIVFGFCV